MNIIDNSFLHLSTQLFFLFGLGILVLSLIKKNYEYGKWGFSLLLLGILESCLIALIKRDFFVLSKELDYTANFIFSLTVLLLTITVLTGITYHYLYRAIPTVFLQMGILFSSVLIVVTFSTSIANSIHKQKMAKRNKPDQIKFIQAEEFEKGSSKSPFSKVPHISDSIHAR